LLDGVTKASIDADTTTCGGELARPGGSEDLGPGSYFVCFVPCPDCLSCFLLSRFAMIPITAASCYLLPLSLPSAGYTCRSGGSYPRSLFFVTGSCVRGPGFVRPCPFLPAWRMRVHLLHSREHRCGACRGNNGKDLLAFCFPAFFLSVFFFSFLEAWRATKQVVDIIDGSIGEAVPKVPRRGCCRVSRKW